MSVTAFKIGKQVSCRGRSGTVIGYDPPGTVIGYDLTARAKMVGLFWPKASKSKAKLISCLGAMSTDVNACEELGPPEVLSIHL